MRLIDRIMRFGAVGAFATALQYLILVVLVRWTGMWPPLASGLGFACSAVSGYWLNYHFTFRSQQQHRSTALKFMVLATVGLGLNSFLMQVLVGAGWYYLVAQVCVTGVVFLWNFVGNSLWTFRAYTGP
jgi:putative flippase GtrA